MFYHVYLSRNQTQQLSFDTFQSDAYRPPIDRIPWKGHSALAGGFAFLGNQVPKYRINSVMPKHEM